MAQIETIRAINPDGTAKEIQINTTQFVYQLKNQLDLAPSIMIVNTDKVSLPVFLQEEFLALCAEEEIIQNYRKTMDHCEQEIYGSQIQKTNGGMGRHAKDIDPYNLISKLLEINLRHQFQNYFSSSLCFTYNLEIKDTSLYQTMAETFYVDWIISPRQLSIDTIENKILAVLKLEIWDKRINALNKSLIVQSKDADLSSAIKKLCAKAEMMVLGQVFRDSNYKQQAKLNKGRIEYFKNNLGNKEDYKWLKKLVDDKEYGDFLGGKCNSSKDKFIAFYLDRYSLGFHKKIGKVFTKNPFPEIDFSKDMDPMRWHFKGTTVLGIFVNGKWMIKPVDMNFIYSKDENKAKDFYFSSMANLDFYPKNSTEFHHDFWNEGLFKPIDTAAMVYQKSKFEGNEGLKSFLVKKENYSNFQDYPLKIADELVRTHFLDGIKWSKEMCSEHLESLIDNREVRKHLKLRFLISNGKFLFLIHDFEKTKAIIPVWFENYDGQEVLHYFYWNKEKPKELYHWNYFPKVTYEPSLTGKSTRVSRNLITSHHFNSIIPFNFMLLGLNEQFWQEYVFKQKDGEFLYLEKVRG
tara:strand:+ start:45454 stop:47184 length:1731 start_codon:yes stop_codon:yes gene_type:complete